MLKGATDSFFELIEGGLQLRVENDELHYRSATGTLTPEKIDTLRRIKPELFSLLEPGIDYLPLSYQQQRLWLLCHWDPDSPIYSMPAVATLKGPLDTAAFARTFHECMCRHQALRTTFPTIDGRPVQAIAAPPGQQQDLPVLDLRELDQAQREMAVRNSIQDEALQAFDLRQGPLWRVSLLRTAEQEHILLMTMHHIISDGWSLRVLFQELNTLYTAFSQGKASPLEEAPRYTDFTLWQRHWLEGDECRTQLDYWKQQLCRKTDFARLPTDRPRAALPTYRGHTLYSTIEAETAGRLKAIAAGEKATLFMASLTALQIVLGQYARSERVRVGSAIANRNHTRTQETLGFFVNTLALETDLSGDPTFSELLRRVRQTAIDAYSHQDVPFEHIINELRPVQKQEAAPHTSLPMFQVFFLLQNIPPQPLLLPGIDARFEQPATGTAKFELAVALREEGDHLQAKWEFNTDLFHTATIEKLAAHYGEVLAYITRNPQSRLSELPQIHADHPDFAPLAKPTAAPSSYVAPRDELETQLAAIWSRLLDVPRVGIRDDFFDVGGHSLLTIRLLDEVEKLTNRRLSLAMFFQTPTIEGQAALLRRVGALDSPSLVPLQPLGTRTPLFCVDGAVRYRALAHRLGTDQPVYGLIPENPTDGQWYSFARIDERVAHYIKVVQTVQPHGPYYFAGLSFAGQIAVMMAQKLRAQGEEVRLLALFDTYGPEYFVMPLKHRIELHLHALRNLDGPARAQYFRDRARLRLRKKPTQAEPAEPVRRDENEDNWQVDLFAREFSAEEKRHLRAMTRQLRRNPEAARYEGDTILFVARDKPMEFLQADPTLGWGRFAPHLTIHQAPGDHTSLIQEPHVEVLAAHLQRALLAAQLRDEH